MNRHEIAEVVSRVAVSINEVYSTKKPLLVGVLNGAFMFCSDLAKKLECQPEIHFVKVSSYSGMQSTGELNTLIGLSASVENRHVILVEDIVDTGLTMEKLVQEIAKLNPATLETACFLFKPTAFKGTTKPRFVGKEIPDDFVVGYGLDYDQLGRELPELYVLD
jgi:hypoxanthine phosphoribosyltransferase